MGSELKRQDLSDQVKPMRLFRDMTLGILGNPGDERRLGAIWHWRTRSVTWMDFSSTTTDTVVRIYYVLAVLAPLSSPTFGVGMSHSMSVASEGQPCIADALGPVWPWLLPLLGGIVGSIFVEVASVRGCNKWGVPVNPSFEERAAYAPDALSLYRDDSSKHGFLGHYRMVILVMLLLVGLDILLPFLIYHTNGVEEFVMVELVMSLCMFSTVFMTFTLLIRLPLLLYLERQYKMYLVDDSCSLLGSVIPNSTNVSDAARGATHGKVI